MPAIPGPPGPARPILDAAGRYDRCEPFVVALEAGYVNNPKDPGGPTNMGVTLAALEAYRGHSCTAADVRALTKAEVKLIYRGPYWNAVRGDLLPAGVDLMTFDSAVNCGRDRAVRFLQHGVGVIEDGYFGSSTLLALQGVNDLTAVVERMRVARLGFYKGLKTWPVFGTGWKNRLATVSITASSWARAG